MGRLCIQVRQHPSFVACISRGLMENNGKSAGSRGVLSLLHYPPIYAAARQCHHCGAYGHITATCTSEQRCLRCGGAHKTSGCTAKQATCLNCGGPHAATEPRCPSWQHERKVAETLASSELPITRRQATVLVRTTGQPTTQGPQQHAASLVPSRVQPGRSYSDAAGDRPARPPVAGNTSTPAPRLPSASPDSRDAVIALLTAALAFATEFLPQDCPARPLCAAALAAQRTLASHGS
ncbi:hypothetical protein HPB49_011093 [Dermacentor silvarum]|uniref:Uncharacterized protein n=1 Tax=Dermacentor silvarum TaxID=543639 RepID=A0ACB8DYU9_DERSI|nr:hypothetical protein HPB49_011093 [Dermacentor silvarum]